MALTISLVLKRLISNPLFVREVRRGKKPTTWKAFIRGSVLAVFAALVALIFFVGGEERDYLQVTLVVYLLVVVSTPPFAAYTAVAVTSEDMTRQFDLIHITTLLNAKLAEGYILSTLYRCRWIIATVVGYMPFALVTAIYTNAYEPCGAGRYTFELCYVPPSAQVIMLTVATAAVFGVMVIGLCFFSTTIGVMLAAWWRSRLMAGLAASFVALGVMMIFLFNSLSAFDPARNMGGNLAALPYLYALCGLALLAARPVMRR